MYKSYEGQGGAAVILSLQGPAQYMRNGLNPLTEFAILHPKAPRGAPEVDPNTRGLKTL